MASEKCPKCGAAAGKTAKFCKICGQNLTADSEPAAKAPDKPATPSSGEDLFSKTLEEVEAGPAREETAATASEVPTVAEPSELPAETPDSPSSDDHDDSAYVIEVKNGLSAGKKLTVPFDRSVVVGAKEDSDLVVQGDRTVSRRHTSFWVEDGVLYAKDEGSTNTTMIYVSQAKKIDDGDMLVVGGTLIQITKEA